MKPRQEKFTTAGHIDTRGTCFVDRDGRHVILRGVNLGGDTKVPVVPDGRTHVATDFQDHRTVDFIGRPAPLDELDSHLARLRHWGFNCVRLLTTWEAVEHAGPGQYDEAYLDYFAEVCRRAGSHGLRVFVDFHQDAWARMSGGDGAPGWTFEAAGLDFTKFASSGAAHLMQHRYDAAIGGRQESYPVMSWSGNYARPANGVMWTLFFAGNDFAPGAKVAGESIQSVLQQHYLGAMRRVAERVAHLDNVIGFDTLNEPGTGYVGAALSGPIVRYRGPIWTPLQALALAAGMPCELSVIAPGRGVVGSERFNADGVAIWLPGREDPFRAAGAWDMQDGGPVALIENYFQRVGERKVDVARDYMVPFFHKVADTVRSVRSDWLIFVETDPFDAIMHGLPEGCPEKSVNASHWYDLSALVTKSFSPERRVHVLTGEIQEGLDQIEDGYVSELSRLADAGSKLNGGSPTLLGECGIQYDMNGAAAYEGWRDGRRDVALWEAQTTALDLMYNAIDRLLLSSTQWNYTVSNANDPMIGDGWNQEDLSIWSKDQMQGAEDPDDGGRAIDGFCRPYVHAAQGVLISQRFNREAGTFEIVIDADNAIVAPTLIYLPKRQFPNGFHVDAPDWSDGLESSQYLTLQARSSGRSTIRITRS